MPSAPSQCWTRKVVWKPMNVSQKCTLPSRSSSIRPVILGNQKYTPGEDGEDDRSKEDVVEVGHDEVAVGNVDAEEGQRHDVDLGVPEEPEQVLPQQWATRGRVVDVRAENPVSQQDQQRGGQDREDEQYEQAGHQNVPREDRHAEHGHAGAEGEVGADANAGRPAEASSVTGATVPPLWIGKLQAEPTSPVRAYGQLDRGAWRPLGCFGPYP